MPATAGFLPEREAESSEGRGSPDGYTTCFGEEIWVEVSLGFGGLG